MNEDDISTEQVAEIIRKAFDELERTHALNQVNEYGRASIELCIVTMTGADPKDVKVMIEGDHYVPGNLYTFLVACGIYADPSEVRGVTEWGDHRGTWMFKDGHCYFSPKVALDFIKLEFIVGKDGIE